MKRFAAIFFLLGAQLSIAGIYDLKFTRVAHVDDPGRCQALLEKTVHELGSLSSVQIIDYGCRKDEYGPQAWEALITYQAAARLAIVSTQTLTSYSTAFYTKLTDCEAKLPLQRELFEKSTGLEALTEYCALEIGFPNRWATQIDGLGTSGVRPDVVSVSLWGDLVDEKSVVAKFEAAAEKYEVTIFESGISKFGFPKHFSLRLYGPEAYTLADYNEMQYGSERACAAAADQVSAALKTAEKPVVAFCDKIHKNLLRLHITTLQKLLDPKSVFSARELTGQYATFSACQVAADKIAKSSTDVYGAVCAGLDKDFRIHLFSRP